MYKINTIQINMSNTQNIIKLTVLRIINTSDEVDTNKYQLETRNTHILQPGDNI